MAKNSEEPNNKIINTVESMDSSGRITRKVTTYNPHRTVGTGCEVDPDPPDNLSKHTFGSEGASAVGWKGKK
jgi:hypothetical protein